METFVQHGFAQLEVPSANAVRSWITRLGYHALHQPLDKSQSWVWIADHSISIGSKKLLVIVGVPLAAVPFGQRALAFADLQLIALVPMDISNGDTVQRELEVAALRTGRPAQIVSDQGSDAVKGIENYREDRPNVAHIPDAAHFGANLLKASWEARPEWPEFVAKVEETSSKLRQSKSAEMMAPRLRPKGRFMNMEVLMRFLSVVVMQLDRIPVAPAVLASYGWLRGYRGLLAVWLAEHRLVRATIAHLRKHGLQMGTLPELVALWKSLGVLHHPSVRELARRWCEYVRVYRPKEWGVRHVASTEVLESLFGKLKQISCEKCKGGGWTGLVLSLGVLVGNRSESELVQALEETPEKKVKSWVQEKLGKTVQWLRRSFRGSVKA
jgi:hypothetical protein